MSFLSGITSFFTGGGVGGTLVKTALLGYALNRMTASANKSADDITKSNIDQGVRLQYNQPNTAAKIPVLYGSAFFGGNMFDIQMTNSNKTMWYAVALCEKTGQTVSGVDSTYTFKDIYWDKQRVQFKSDGITVDYTQDRSGNIDRSLSGLVKIYFYAGNSTSGQLPENYTGAVPEAYSLFPTWTQSTHQLNNLIFALIQVDYNRDKNVTGISNDLMFHIENSLHRPGDVLYDYLTSGNKSRSANYFRYGAGIEPENIDTQSLIDLNTYSDQSITYTNRLLDGTVQTGIVLNNRYQINGLLDTEAAVLENIEKITNAAASWLTYDGSVGKWGVVINKPDTSKAEFNDDNILGSISVSGTGLRELYNATKVEFPHRELRDSGDFVNIVLDPQYRNNNEIDKSLDLSYDIINEPVQAKLLGFIELKQSRLDKIIQFRADFTQIRRKPGDVIEVTNNQLGYSNKLFRIISISEVTDDTSLQVEITALEYDNAVYDLSDLDRYEISNTDGIITIGSIGKPGTPQINKVERDSRPRILVESTAPTGIVEGMEFWLSTDVSQPEDDLRSYSLIATRRPVGGGTFGSGTTVLLDYDALGTTNFLMKTRGFNSTTVGPFSDPSGSIYFDPKQTTDAIGPDTTAIDATGGLLTALAVVDLLKGVDDLYQDVSGNGSMFEKIFQVFEDVTGLDIVGEASGGSLVVKSEISTYGEGELLTSNTASFDFVGKGVTTVASNDNVTVTINDTLPDGTEYNQILVWDGEKWVLNKSCCNGPAIPDNLRTNPPIEANTLTAIFPIVSSRLPPDETSVLDPDTPTSANQVPITGSFYFKVGRGYTGQSLYGSLTKGTGSIRLYKSDGSLVEELSSDQLIIDKNLVEIPFATRELGTDYYILYDKGIVKYCKEELPALTNPTEWSFNTPLISTTPYSATGDNPAASPGITKQYLQIPKSYNNPTCINYTLSLKVNPYYNGNTPVLLSLEATRAYSIATGTGNLYIHDASTDEIVQTIPANSVLIESIVEAPLQEGYYPTGDNIFSVKISGLTPGGSYYYTMSEGFIRGVLIGTRTTAGPAYQYYWTTKSYTEPAYDCYAGPLEAADLKISPAITKDSAWTFNTYPELQLLSWSVQPNSSSASRQTNITLNFNTKIGYADRSLAFYIYNADGSLYQKITPDVGSNLIIFSNNSSTINLNPTKDFEADSTYYLLIDADFLRNSCDTGIPFAGISDPNIIRFTTSS